MKIVSGDKISKVNAKLILDFENDCYSNGLGDLRVKKYKYTLRKIARMLGKDFDKTTKEDLKKLIGEINKSDYADWSKHDFKVCIKRFWKWLKQTEGKEYPKVVYTEY